MPLIALVSPKMKLFYKGRKETFSKLENSLSKTDKTIWMHCASLGEFEQGRPVLEKLKLHYPNYKIVLSFFSPSGYEIRKDYDRADVIVYLPLDTQKNAVRFIELAHPTLAIFVKYEFWPNILSELRYRNIKTILISGIFRKEQAFFKNRRKWFKNQLKAFAHFFVQNDDSVKLLRSIGFTNATQNGDTRFDRVKQVIEQKKQFPFIDRFASENHVLIAGSTWPKDESLLVHYINEYAAENEKFIIAPHNINILDIKHLINAIQKRTKLFSEISEHDIPNCDVLIIDSIGILTSVYQYADIAYVGGGFGAGIHNILEPATYGIPIIIGPNYQKFKEALDLIEQKACFEVHSLENLTKQLQHFYTEKTKTKNSGLKAKYYIDENVGATKIIMSYIAQELKS